MTLTAVRETFRRTQLPTGLQENHMASERTISRNRFFDPVGKPATISAQVAGTGFTIVAFLDRELDDVKTFPESKILSATGISSTIEKNGTHILEFIVAFRSKADKTCDITCQLTGSSGPTQKLRASVTAKADDIARVCFHAPIN
jgi:hypothetical protein